MVVHRKYVSALVTGLMCFILLVMKPGFLRADEVVLSNNDRLSGKVISSKDGLLVFESDMLGQISIKMDKVKSVQTEESKPGKQQQALAGAKSKSTQKKEAKLPVAADPAKMKWSGNVSVGFTGRQGNTSRVATASNIKIKGSNALWGINGFLQNRYAEQEVNHKKIRTDNEIRGGGRVRRKTGEKISYFVESEVERDEKEKLRLRSIYNGGLGVNWIKTKELGYETRFGTGYQHETFEDETSRSSHVGNLASELTYKINEHVEVVQETVWMPDFSSEDAYRITAESAATVYLDKNHNLFVRAGIKHDYDNQPNEKAVEQLDIYYFSQFGYSF